MLNTEFMDPTLTSFTSITLLGRVRDLSNQEAWNEFVHRYTPKIFLWCKAFSLQDQDASDVTQQVLMKLVTAMQVFDYDPERGSFRGWLKTVTSNAVRDLIRKKSSNDITGEQALPWLEQLGTESAIDALTRNIESAYQEELLLEAENRVQLRVKPTTWRAYQLQVKQNKTATEVASELSIKVAEVYVAKSRVIKMLRETIESLKQIT